MTRFDKKRSDEFAFTLTTLAMTGFAGFFGVAILVANLVKMFS